jgi:WD40-like Beta Propeller Repeat
MSRCSRSPEIKRDEGWSSAVWMTAPSPGWPAQSAPSQRPGRLTAADGHLTDVYRPGAGVISQFMPSFLPDGRAFLYAQDSSNAQQRGVFLGSLDSPTVTRLLPEPANAAISPRGYLFYGQQGTVFAQRFDIDHKRLVGDPVNLGSGAAYTAPFTDFAVAGDLLVWSNVQTPSATLTWVDRNGRILGSTPEAAQYIGIALAPDEQRVVAAEADAQTFARLFLIELTRPIHTRLTTGNQMEADPVWSPDSREVAFNSYGGLFLRRIDQDGRTPLLASSVVGVEDWTHDGRFVIFMCGSGRICALPLKGDRTPVPLIESSSSVDEELFERCRAGDDHSSGCVVNPHRVFFAATRTTPATPVSRWLSIETPSTSELRMSKPRAGSTRLTSSSEIRAQGYRTSPTI